MHNYKTKLFTQTTVNAILLTGILSFLMYPFVFFGFEFMDLGFFAWFYLVPLLVAIHPYNFKSKFLLVFLCGLLAHFGHLYWLIPAIHNFGGLNYAGSIGVLLVVVVILSALFGLFVSVASWINVMNKIPLAILLPIFLVSRDRLIHEGPLGGFPWALPAYSQGYWIRFFQWVDHTSIFGLDLYIYVVNALIAEGLILLFYRKQIDKMVSRFLIVFFLMMTSFYMSFLASQQFEKSKVSPGTVSVALIQANIHQDLKWDPYRSQENLHKHLRLTNLAVQNGAELVIWPETAYPFGLQWEKFSEEKFLEQDQLPAPIFFGAVTTSRADGGLKLYNSVIHVDKNASLINSYHKRHLVPYGEYVPFKKYLPFEKLTQGVGNFEVGPGETLFEVGTIKYGSLICYEDVFLDSSLRFARKGADVLVNFTNDAWYGDSSAPYQHLVFSQFRALENRLPLVRATNTGVTAIVAPTGEILSQLPIFKEKYLLHSLKVEKATSFVTRHGYDWTYVVAGLAALIFLYTLGKWRFGPVKKEF